MKKAKGMLLLNIFFLAGLMACPQTTIYASEQKDYEEFHVFDDIDDDPNDEIPFILDEDISPIDSTEDNSDAVIGTDDRVKVNDTTKFPYSAVSWIKVQLVFCSVLDQSPVSILQCLGSKSS